MNDLKGPTDYRVVNTGDSFTVALIEYDPLGNPCNPMFELPEASSLAELLTILDSFRKCVNRPVLDLRSL